MNQEEHLTSIYRYIPIYTLIYQVYNIRPNNMPATDADANNTTKNI